MRSSNCHCVKCRYMYQNLRYFALFCLLFVLLVIIYVQVAPTGSHFMYNARSMNYNTWTSQRLLQSYLSHRIISVGHPETKDTTTSHVNLDDSDVLVFLHIQKTGGSSFGRHLVRHIRNHACLCRRGRKRCRCKNHRDNHWLVSRYSTGWMCGLHADWTELHGCVERKLNRKDFDKDRIRKYFYATMLRDPLARFASEWRHVRRGATWSNAKLVCNGLPANLPKCYSGQDWSGVSLFDFVHCPYNLATNRQTRMMSNLSAIHCYNYTAYDSLLTRNTLMLKSAVHNMHQMSYVGLVEYQLLSQYLFTRTFNLSFTVLFWQQEDTVTSHLNLSQSERDLATEANRLDIELYQSAVDLFFLRVRYCMLNDPLILPEFKDSIRSLNGPQLSSIFIDMSNQAETVLRSLGAKDISMREKMRIQRKIRKKVKMSEEPEDAESPELEDLETTRVT